MLIDDPGSSVESKILFFKVATPNDDDPGSSVETLTADAAARASVVLFTR